MKLLTIAIPCYNSEGYMSKAIESVLCGGDDVEILLINDGSSDATGQIADEYEKKYPGIIRAIHQENKGHGGAVNTGIENATGMYYKVLDSDDWFDERVFLLVLERLKKLVNEKKPVDMFLCNYVYDKPSLNKQKPIKYTNVLPVDHVFTWDHVGHFKTSQNILMHSVMYRTKLLRANNIKLPEHTFYVDNLFVYTPFPYVKTMYYMNVNLYHYFIGREDQSVNEKVMIKRIDQQINVNKLMIDAWDLTRIENKDLRGYMVKYLAMITMVSTVLLVKDGTEDSLKKRDELWDYLKQNEGVYKLVNKRFLSKPVQFRSVPGQFLIKTVYGIAQKLYGFN
ncbi:MAG: glycosyltransferase family 2 protein [Eubacterium sp.]|nr:glycosyltransferase family 2 protein [Eubacterium sp.]